MQTAKNQVTGLSDNEIKALGELKERINEKYPETELILYGSKARGDFDEESDIDVLAIISGAIGKEMKEYWVDINGKPTIRVVTPVEAIEKDIRGIKFNIELKYDVIIGLDIESKEYWDSRFSKVTPIHRNIDKDGIAI